MDNLKWILTQIATGFLFGIGFFLALTLFAWFGLGVRIL